MRHPGRSVPPPRPSYLYSYNVSNTPRVSCSTFRRLSSLLVFSSVPCHGVPGATLPLAGFCNPPAGSNLDASMISCLAFSTRSRARSKGSISSGSRSNRTPLRSICTGLTGDSTESRRAVVSPTDHIPGRRVGSDGAGWDWPGRDRFGRRFEFMVGFAGSDRSFVRLSPKSKGPSTLRPRRGEASLAASKCVGGSRPAYTQG